MIIFVVIGNGSSVFNQKFFHSNEKKNSKAISKSHILFRDKTSSWELLKSDQMFKLQTKIL